MGKQDSRLTADRVRELFNYDPETGIVSWREDSPPKKVGPLHKAGDRFGTSTYPGKNRSPKLTGWVAGKQVLLHRIIWLWVTGEMPPLSKVERPAE